MSLLGTMMVRAGLLSDEQLSAVQARSAERKLSFVEALLDLGVTDEDSVVSFLHSKLMIPRVGASVLDTVDKGALLRIPAELAQRLAVLPISADETGNLTVAMVDPTDMRAVDAISAHTGAYLVRAVAPLRIIRAAISRHYNLPMPEPRAASVAQPAAAAPVAAAPVARPAIITQPAPIAAPVAPPIAPIAAPISPPIAAPIAAPIAPPIAAPIVPVPTVGGTPGIQAPTIAARPAFGAAPVAPPMVPPVAASPARPEAAPSTVAPTTIVPGTPLVPLPVTPRPAAASPGARRPPSEPVPAATIKPSAVIRPSAVIQPSAVLQPSAVIMPGGAPVATTRPAVVLPASAQAPYGNPGGTTPQQGPTTPGPTTPGVITNPGPHAAPSPAAVRTNLAADFQPGGSSNFEPPRNAAPIPAPAPAPTPAPITVQVAPPPGDTLVGGSRADIVDIPLDDFDDPPPVEPTTLIPEDRAPTQTWIPPQFGVANEIIPLSHEAFHRLLPRFAMVKTRDEITDLLLDFLAEGFSRVIMFTHIKGEIRGRDARGEDLMVEAVRQIRIPATGPSLFSGVIERQRPYFGAMRTDTAIDAAFFSALGGVDGVVLCLPVIMRDKVPLLVFASGSHNPVDPRSLQDLTNEVSAALERIIVLDKARAR